MGIGPLEIAIVVVLALIFFGYRKLPALGRSAGEGLRKIKGTAAERIGDGDEVSTSVGRSAGKGVRELRELREAVSAKPGERGRGSAPGEPERGSGERRDG